MPNKVLLWQNASPGSSFDSQDITLSRDVTDYDFIEIVYSHNPSDTGHKTTGCIPTTVGQIYLDSYNNYNGTLCSRICYWYSNSVGFGDCDSYNNDNVPYQIYGIKEGGAQ